MIFRHIRKAIGLPASACDATRTISASFIATYYIFTMKAADFLAALFLSHATDMNRLGRRRLTAALRARVEDSRIARQVSASSAD